MIKKIFARNILWWVFLVLVLSQSVNWNLCAIERGKYLLGIYYNGHFQNASDGIVYQDYLKTHGITDEFIRQHI
jgi:hypothetical protein